MEGFFTEDELYLGDALNPDLENPTPVSIIARMPQSHREKRVAKLVAQAHSIVEEAWELHGGGKRKVATCVLYSGGNDSTTLAHMMRKRSDFAVHCNTGIGIEETRQFVRDTCSGWGLELLERHPPVSYRDLVLERGFPGAAMHFKMFHRLKQRQLDQVRREFVKKPRQERILYIAGRRRSESQRRKNIPRHERIGSTVWASPLVMWTKPDLNTYRLMFHNTDNPVPVNRVSELLHMSGECLCGAFAKEGELDEIARWFPDTAAHIRELERDVRAAGHKEPFCTWGHRSGKPSTKTGMLCTSCDFDQETLFDPI